MSVINTFFNPSPLTRGRRWAAIAVALVADGLQLLFGPLGWAGVDQVIDVVAMIVTSRLIGFHPLLLPTFVVELIPVADLLPTWTGCVFAVILLRKRQAQQAPPAISSPPVIDVQAEPVASPKPPVIEK